MGLPLSNLHYIQTISWITTESRCSLHSGNTFIEQHIDLTWIFLGLKYRIAPLSPISKWLFAVTVSTFLSAYTATATEGFFSVCATSLECVYSVCVYGWMDQATYLRLGSEGMPLDRGRGDGGGGGGEVLCGF